MSRADNIFAVLRAALATTAAQTTPVRALPKPAVASREPAQTAAAAVPLAWPATVAPGAPTAGESYTESRLVRARFASAQSLAAAFIIAEVLAKPRGLRDE